MPELQVGDTVYEPKHYKKVGTIGHILEDRERYAAPYSVTFKDPDPDQPGRDYFSRDELLLVLPVDYQTPAEKVLAEKMRRVNQYLSRYDLRPDTEGLEDWEEGAVLAQAKVRRDIEKIIAENVDIPF